MDHESEMKIVSRFLEGEASGNLAIVAVIAALSIVCVTVLALRRAK